MDMLAEINWVNVLLNVGKFANFVLSILLILIVIPQKEKGGGLTGAFGGSGSIATFGVKTTDVVAKATWVLFALWAATGLGLAIVDNRFGEKAGQPVKASSVTLPTDNPGQ